MVPRIEGWMWQVYVYVPAVANTRVIDTFVLLPAMSAGAPACCVKKTLCGTDHHVCLHVAVSRST